MYESHFGLKENPFSITPDPEYLYLSPHHQDALGHLLYGAGENGGFVQLTGEVGTGKTTLVRALLEQNIDNVDVALCLNPRLTVEEFLASVCDELGVEYTDGNSLKQLTDALSRHLLKRHGEGRRIVLLVDEAQNLSREVLEQVRLLTNLETAKHKLLRIILVGQPELRELLERRDLRQLAQRITARHHLDSLNASETRTYITHRLKVAGGKADLFTPRACKAVYRYTRGVPRLINVLCDRALLAAYSGDQQRVDHRMVKAAAAEVIVRPAPWRRSVWTWLAGLLLFVLFLVGVWAATTGSDDVVLPATETSAPAANVEDSSASTAPPETPVADNSMESAPDEIGRKAIAPAKSPSSIQNAPAPATAENSSESTPVDSQAEIEAETVPAPVAPKPRGGLRQGIPTPSVSLAPLQQASPNNLAAALLASWGQIADGVSLNNLCRRAPALGLSCMSGRDGLAGLRKFNRPAIINVIGDDGRSHPMFVRALTDDALIVDSGEGLVSVPFEQARPRWDGNWTMLYRRQGGFRVIEPGARGETVRWLRRRLSMADQQPVLVGPGAEVYDPALVERVRLFQHQNQLTADGLVGGRTMSLLHGLLPDPGTPLLREETR